MSSWISHGSLLIFGLALGAGLDQAYNGYQAAIGTATIPVVMAVPMDANLTQCLGELNQYMALANKFFYQAAGAPTQMYWEEPYMYLPNDARTCNSSFDPVGCAKTQPGTYIFELKEIFDGTPALVPVDPNPPPPPPVAEPPLHTSSI